MALAVTDQRRNSQKIKSNKNALTLYVLDPHDKLSNIPRAPDSHKSSVPTWFQYSPAITSQLVASEYSNRYSPYLFIPGTWCANVIMAGRLVYYMTLPDQPNLQRHRVYQTKSCPYSVLPDELEGRPFLSVHIFNVDKDEELKAYHRTGWEFSADKTVFVGVCTLGASSLVTIPLSAKLYANQSNSLKIKEEEVTWSN
eukprot:TRINITY_DN13908_c0_g1_i1.p1 TRINITY_DN13908_c0_g1~~TRINITY_DN13908_c0_g1_i1.p1  ORF type:complete len:198 (+),score=10.71 TRINITY_DN13908_c0_g1_i1:19-612(+)